jgi:hypothetical protein
MIGNTLKHVTHVGTAGSDTLVLSVFISSRAGALPLPLSCATSSVAFDLDLDVDMDMDE